MESPQFWGPAEECHSSESGWTMYIGSPVGDEDNDSNLPHRRVTDEEFDKDEGNYNNIDDIHRDDTSDDSMASDASSGPSHREQSWEIQKGGSSSRGRGTVQYYKNTDEAKQNEINHCSSNCKSKGSSVKKNRSSHVKGNEEKDNHEVNPNGKVIGSKVRKSHWMGKRK